jgi:hypothetical protein
MLDLPAYKVLHLLGVVLLFTAFGGLLVAARAGVQTGVSRKVAGITHGVALAVILIAGFGALAKLGLSNPGIWPLWVWLKLVIWLLLGAAVVAIKRSPRSATLLWWVLPLLGAAAGWLALTKPS